MSFNAYYMLRSLDDKHFKSRVSNNKKEPEDGFICKSMKNWLSEYCNDKNGNDKKYHCDTIAEIMLDTCYIKKN